MDTIVPVAKAMLSQVNDSILVVLIFAVFTKTCPAAKKVESVHVR